ncbi:MAG TPA: ABC transporter ATP-binding protein [Nitrospira sp.]|nr:ABC transporter ATP-binding protein [Nitrospira sp.]
MTAPAGNDFSSDSLGSLSGEPFPAYDVRSAWFHYGSLDRDVPQWALRDVSFFVKPGEMLGIVGPNGSGKTSLLKLLARIVPEQQGTIRLFGKPLAELKQEDVAQAVGFVPQDTSQTFPFTVAETVLMGRFPHRHRTPWDLGFGWDSPSDRAIAQQAMVTMDVWKLAARRVTELSGGERQRVVIARALTQEPRALLLDEPTAFLDLQHQIGICALLHRLKQERGLTIILVSHDLNLASQYCDRVLLLDRGQVIRLGVPAEVVQREVLEAVYRCRILVDCHPISGLPRVTLPSRDMVT